MATPAMGGETTKTEGVWDTGYEWKTVALLTIGFGLVGLDRWVIAHLAGFSTMVPDLGLDQAKMGLLISALGVAWGVAAFFLGGFSDMVGRKAVLVPSLVAFSLLSGLSGFATGFGIMLFLRALMGVAEGAFCPTSFATVAEASLPKRRGFNLGLQQSAFALLGLGIGPILTVQLLKVMSWQWVFAIVGIPGLIIAALIFMTVREPATVTDRKRHKAAGTIDANAPKMTVGTLFAHRNVALSMLGLLCAMCGIFVISAFMPSYLTGYLKLSNDDAGLVAAAIGFGGFLGQWWLAGASDIIGRRTMAIAGFLVGAAFLYLFMQLGADSGVLVLFVVLFISAGFAFGLLSLITGPIAAEAAPLGMIAGTAGAIVAVGEIFGGGVAPFVGGWIAEQYGIQNTLWVAFGGLAVGVVVSLFYKETAPKFAKAGKGEESALDVFEDQHPEGIVR